MPTTSHTSEEVRELHLLNRRYADLVRECRLESLGERLRRRPIEVVRSRAGFGGDRWVLFLEDGSALRIGQGEAITVLGFYAELHLPRGAPAVP